MKRGATAPVQCKRDRFTVSRVVIRVVEVFIF